MTNKWLLLILYLFNTFLSIKSREASLQCWKCEVTAQSSEEPGVFIDDCQAQFDFTEHTLEDCDGKCWKSIDLIDLKRIGNNSEERLKLKDKALASLRSSRRCFSADELLRANEMGIVTANGCRKLKRDSDKSKEICFCSDQDMCNQVMKVSNSLFIQYASVLTLFLCLL
ncbi:unnamed protein product [Adineta ricciae]|uniref:Protein sleepless n=1 Tax=Adineta ricciae TaxID=249248 RepID=A0A814AWF1_ADIRI|nr:unnamed protein product [Adineta ricciae]